MSLTLPQLTVLKSLVEETMVLGQVSQINPQDIAIALPNNLTGFVSLTRISPPLTKLVESLVNDDDGDKDDYADVHSLDSLFTIGQWLRTVVIENTTHTDISDKTKKKHIELSLEPELVNAGVHLDDILPKTLLQVSVSSVEDHGIIVSLGLENLSGFIRKSALGSYTVENIHVGQVFLAVVEHRPKNKVVQLSLDLESSSAPIKDVSDIISLLPGDTVQCLVSEVRAAGAGGKVLGMLDATIDKLHTGAASIDENQTVRDLFKERLTSDHRSNKCRLPLI
jgi:rRNA biogenesis protein RRP5